MWDGINCHRARMLGWIAESVDLEPIRLDAELAELWHASQRAAPPG
jgi:hypothetical protein